MARSMLSAGILDCLAVVTAVRSRGLALMSPPPIRAATVISLIILVKILPRFWSLIAFLCLIELHLEWPDIGFPFVARLARRRARARSDARAGRVSAPLAIGRVDTRGYHSREPQVKRCARSRT